MKRALLIVSVFVVELSASSLLLPAQSQGTLPGVPRVPVPSQPPQTGNAPGLPTVARTYIQNRTRAEAIPVAVQNLGEAVETVTSRQGWEYRVVSVLVNQDLATQLNTAGAEGWEVIGQSPAAGGTSSWLLKRPRVVSATTPQ